MLNRLSITKKFVFIFFTMGLIPLTILAIISSLKVKEVMKNQVMKHLVSLKELKSEQIEEYLSLVKDQAVHHSNDLAIIDAVKDFTDAFWKVEHDLKTWHDSNMPIIEKELRDTYQYHFKEFDRAIQLEPHLRSAHSMRKRAASKFCKRF